jgi:hypothetical protein
MDEPLREIRFHLGVNLRIVSGTPHRHVSQALVNEFSPAWPRFISARRRYRQTMRRNRARSVRN